MNDCPKRAIEASHGYIIGILCLLNMVISVWFWKEVEAFIHIPPDNGWVQIPVTIIRWLLTFAVMIISYRIYHYLLRVPGVRQIFYYTSFTRFKFWRRYKPSRRMIE